MNHQKAETPKPRSLSDSEWAEVCRASRESYFRYVFCTLDLVGGALMILLGAFLYILFDHDGQLVVAFQAAIHSGVFLGVAVFALVVVIRRSIDWRGMRKTGHAAGL